MAKVFIIFVLLLIVSIGLAKETIVFYGSNTVGEKLMPALVKEYLIYKGVNAKDIQEIAKTSIENEKVIEVLNKNGLDVPRFFEIKAHGSGTSFGALDREDADIGMSSRPIKAKEVDLLKRFGDMTSSSMQKVIALDGVAVILEPKNPIMALPIETIAKIFAGEIVDWSLVGNYSGAIKVCARDIKSGTYDTFKSLVMKPHGLKIPDYVKRFESSEKLSQSVTEGNECNIGFIGLAYILEAKPLAIDECGIAYMPTTFYVKTEEYPLSRRLYLYIPEANQNDFTKDFLAFIKLEKAQNIIKEIGFVDLLIERSTLESSATTQLSVLQEGIKNRQSNTVLEKYVEHTQGANRLSATFRFKTGSSVLDSRAEDDIKRLASFLMTKNKNGKVIILGFADSVGGYIANRKLSLNRATTVGNLLQEEGIINRVDGMGEEVAIACNNSEKGKQKNRHVQVWVK